jgi:rhodanese-related sulfurtransferase
VIDIRKFAVVLVLLFAALPAKASDVISSADAFALVGKGDITLIDVRSVEEWRQSGIPKGAKAISIHDPGGMTAFVAKVTSAVNGRKDRPVALICARGVRSTRADWALGKAGFTKILNVREGTLGNWVDGPGWFARKLPIDPYKEARSTK